MHKTLDPLLIPPQENDNLKFHAIHLDLQNDIKTDFWEKISHEEFLDLVEYYHQKKSLFENGRQNLQYLFSIFYFSRYGFKDLLIPIYKKLLKLNPHSNICYNTFYDKILNIFREAASKIINEDVHQKSATSGAMTFNNLKHLIQSRIFCATYPFNCGKKIRRILNSQASIIEGYKELLNDPEVKKGLKFKPSLSKDNLYIDIYQSIKESNGPSFKMLVDSIIRIINF